MAVAPWIVSDRYARSVPRTRLLPLCFRRIEPSSDSSSYGVVAC